MNKIKEFIQKQEHQEKYMTDERFYPIPELRLKAFEVENPKIIFIGLDPYPRKESAVGISFYDPLIESQNHKGRKVSIDNLVAFLNLKDTNYKDFFQRTQQRGVQWLNLCLTYNPTEQDRQQHINFWKPVIQYYFSTLKEKVVVVLLGNEAQKLKTPDNFVRVCGKHPSPMANPGYYNLEEMINQALGYEFNWK